MGFQGPPVLSRPAPPRPPVTHCHGLERLHNDPVDFIKQLAGHLSASGALQVETQVVDSPLATMDVVVILLVREGTWPSGHGLGEPSHLTSSAPGYELVGILQQDRGSLPRKVCATYYTQCHMFNFSLVS